MVISLFLILYTVFTAFISGLVLYKCFSWLFKTEPGSIHSSFTTFAGLCWIAFVLQIIHLFLPISILSHVIIWAINVSVWMRHKAFFTERLSQLKRDFFSSSSVILIFVLISLAAIIGVAAKPGIGDIADYHLQAVKWIETYKVVPGIGNLRRQLGNNSNWFLLNAFFGCDFLKLNSVYVINASILLLAVIYFIPVKGEKLWIYKTIVLLYLVATAFRKYVGAVTNDYAVTLFTLMVFTQWIQSALQKETTKTSWIIVFIIFMMITFKLSALPLFIMVIGILYSQWKQRQLSLKAFVILCCIGTGVFVPWLYTNVMNCGYLCYPISSPDLFNVDWKMRKSILEWEVMYNLVNGRLPGLDPDVTIHYPFSVWFPLWIKTIDLFSLALLVLFSGSTALVSGLFIFKNTRNKMLRELNVFHVWIVLIAIYIGLYLWFTHGPTPRFVFGYLVFGLAFYMLLITSVWNKINMIIERVQSKLIYIIVLILLLTGAVFVKDHFTIQQIPHALLKPLDYPQVTYTEVVLNGHIIRVPRTNEQCWDLPLPCTSILDKHLEMRGSSLEDGFKISR